MQPTAGVNYYEVLQISPTADPETIHRVYRLLAQRFHPDNQTTGDAERFHLIREAYTVLSDAQRRADYDANGHTPRARTDRSSADSVIAPNDFEFEQAARLAVLEALYAQRRTQPAQSGLYDRELAERLGVTPERLEFTLWFLKEKGLVRRAVENSMLTITAEGAEYLEHQDRVGRRRLPLQQPT